jgi:hypothetical protein
MTESRRRWLAAFVAVLGALAAKPLSSEPEAQDRTQPRTRPYPNGRNPSTDRGIDEPPPQDPKVILEANQKKLRSDVSKLYEMVSELKEQVEHTDANSMLSVSLVKKAQQIESLAKQIKNMAKG